MAKRIAIIGAGPAGSLAATLLARSGIHVTLIEQHRFPRDKVCGECISALGADVLHRAGVTRALRGAVPLQCCFIHATGGASAQFELPAPMWGLSRFSLDQALLSAAEKAGARILQPMRWEGLTNCDQTSVRVRDLADNALHDVHCDLLLLADGKSVLPPGRPRPTADIGLKTHFESVNAPRDAIHLIGLRGHYVGLAPIENNRWNLCMSVPARKLAAHATPTGLFRALLEENTVLKAHLSSARQCSPWLASALPRFPVRHDWPENIIPLGNAAAALEPIGGEGIGLALRSAELASQAIIEGDASNLRLQFEGLWRKRRSTCRAAAICLSQPWLCNLAVRLLDEIPSLVNPILPLLGKLSPRLMN